MALKTFDKKEDVPEAQRAAAIETKDGKWVAEDVELGDAGKRALDAERLRAKKAEDEKKAADDRAAAAERERDELKRQKNAEEKGVSKEALDKLREEDAKARKPLEDENAKLKADLRKVKVRDRARAMAVKAGMIEERLDDDVMDAIEKRLDLASDGETLVVKDKSGAVTTTTPEKFFTEVYKAEKKYLYKGTGANGSGADGSEGGGGDTGTYDPVKAGKKLAEEQKKQSEAGKLAFT